MITVQLIIARSDGSGAIPADEETFGPSLYRDKKQSTIDQAKRDIKGMPRIAQEIATAQNKQLSEVRVFPDHKTSRIDAEAVARFVRKHIGVKIHVTVIDPPNLEASGLVFL